MGPPAGRYPGLRVLRPLIRTLVRTPQGLGAVNWTYQRLTLRQKRRFLVAFGTADMRPEGTWTAIFSGRRVILPLHGDFPAAWSLALSFEGQEIEVHRYYERLLRLSPPQLLFDIGAYYGLHSLK